MKSARPLLIIAALAIAAAAALYAFSSNVFDRPPEPSLIGGPFQMVDQTGKPVDQGILQGKWSAVFFGFTYCPDVCPATLQALSAAVPLLKPDEAKKLQIVFVSVDPGRDTPAQVKLYLDSQRLPAGTIGLTGSQAQVDAIAKAYRVVHEKAGEGADYTMNHSTAVYLMDPKGRFDSVLAYGLTPPQMAELISKAMRN
jgi:protein SCO1/2